VRLPRALLAILVSLTIFAVAGEIACRSLDLVDRLNGFPRRLFVASDDPHLPYVMRPGIDTVVRGVRVQVNALGLRGPEAAPVPAPGVHRVLALGDSATFGEYLPADEAFPALLQRELEARTGERFEVLNAGVEGYNSEAELAFLQTRGLALRPETVVVGLNLNDYDRTPVLGPLGVLTADQTARLPSGSLANRSELYLVLRWLAGSAVRLLQGGPAVQALPKPAEGRRFSEFDLAVSRQRKEYYRQPTDARWGVMIDALRGMRAATDARHVRLVIAIIPDGDQVGVEAPDLVPQEKLRAVCADVGLECVDLYPAFAAASEEPLHVDTMHPNAAGQRLVARELAARLVAAR
jgi:lysophospholipase L1-like esterase